jgi:hypothetical protein
MACCNCLLLFPPVVVEPFRIVDVASAAVVVVDVASAAASAVVAVAAFASPDPTAVPIDRAEVAAAVPMTMEFVPIERRRVGTIHLCLCYNDNDEIKFNK